MPLRMGVPDLISNSYFPAVAAVQLGFLRDAGLDVSLELIFPVSKTYEALREGDIDFVAGSAHSALAAFPEWEGCKLLAAQAQGMYWFLVMRADLVKERADLGILKGKRIGAAPWVDMGLRRLLSEAGIDIERDKVSIAPVPGAVGSTINFGLTAAKSLENGNIDGFWANGVGAEVAVRSGAGRILLDVRRGDGPKKCFNYTMASIATSDKVIREIPSVADAMVHAIAATHKALKADVTLATKVGTALFPASEAAFIAELIRRDLPFYDTTISREFVAGMNQFCRDIGILRGNPTYEQVVAGKFGRFGQQ
jgi:NitT/TauT family transport system substrate-binding protein